MPFELLLVLGNLREQLFNRTRRYPYIFILSNHRSYLRRPWWLDRRLCTLEPSSCTARRLPLRIAVIILSLSERRARITRISRFSLTSSCISRHPSFSTACYILIPFHCKRLPRTCLPVGENSSMEAIYHFGNKSGYSELFVDLLLLYFLIEHFVKHELLLRVTFASFFVHHSRISTNPHLTTFLIRSSTTSPLCSLSAIYRCSRGRILTATRMLVGIFLF